MKKKILLVVATIGVIAVSASMFAAFEAHIINVTAKIENALTVPIDEIDFGTVFPEEQVDRNLDISLSDSFIAADRVDDVQYIIRQKPKCGITTNNGEVLVGETATGHISMVGGQKVVNCGDAPRALIQGESWGQLPLLCPYLSKHKAANDQDGNDDEIDAFHQIGQVDLKDPGDDSDDAWVWTDVKGYLAKSDNDVTDKWVIDLKTPCFEGQCAQDWDSFVKGINSNANPADFIQAAENEEKVFGCDLWVEVRGISIPTFDCAKKADVMLVLDRSGSIEPTELSTLKTAAIAFVDALNPSADKAHMGQSSFNENASLDQILTDNQVSIKAAINALASGGFTNLMAGITVASTELASINDRSDSESPDYMVIITDGEPNRPDPATAKAVAEATATTARGAGTTIYVIGVGVSDVNANWLKSNIATSTNHYFDASNFDDLQTILEDLVECT